jgi:hypothetical protein
MEEETEEEEEITLGEKLISYVENGYRIVCRGDDWAQLWRPKRFNGFWFLLWTILGVGWGGLFYILYYISKGDRVVYIGLGTDGLVYGWESES